MLAIDHRPIDFPAALNATRSATTPTSKPFLVCFGLGDVAGVIDGRTDRLIAGHGRIEALRALQRSGAAAPRGVEVRDGAWLVPILTGLRLEDAARAEALLLALNELTKAGGWNLESSRPPEGLGEHDAKGLGFSDESSPVSSERAEEKEEEEGRTEEPEKIWVKEGSSSSGSIGSTSATRSPRGSARDPLRPGEARRRGDRSAACDLRLGARGSGATLQTTKWWAVSSRSSRDRRKAQADRAPSTRSTDWRSWAMGNASSGARAETASSGIRARAHELSMTRMFLGRLSRREKATTGAKGIRPVHWPNDVLPQQTEREGSSLHGGRSRSVSSTLIGNRPRRSTRGSVLVPGSTLIACERTGRRAFMGEVDSEERADHDRALADARPVQKAVSSRPLIGCSKAPRGRRESIRWAKSPRSRREGGRRDTRRRLGADREAPRGWRDSFAAAAQTCGIGRRTLFDWLAPRKNRRRRAPTTA